MGYEDSTDNCGCSCDDARDTMLDVLALYQAVVNLDLDGATAIMKGTRCMSCLAVNCVRFAVTDLAPGSGDRDDDGLLTQEFIRRFGGFLDHCREEELSGGLG